MKESTKKESQTEVSRMYDLYNLYIDGKLILDRVSMCEVSAYLDTLNEPINDYRITKVRSVVDD